MTLEAPDVSIEIDEPSADPEHTTSGPLRKRFKLLAQLGAGGMALVHLAVARGAAGAEKLVVLKSIRPEFAEDKKVRSMFADEARLSVQLTHPNLVQTYDVVMFGALPVIVMEYLEGQSLHRCVDKGLPLPLRLYAILEILSGLEYAHSAKGIDLKPLGVVHRDMSPQNVIVTFDGQVKVLDFGIAKAVNQSVHTETGELKGKLRYMSPEQMVARGKIDGRADLFAVGVMLWEALTQTKIWGGMSDVEVIQTILASGVPTPSTATPNVPEALERICMKAVSEKPEQRYECAFAMHEELKQALETLGLQTNVREMAAWMEAKFAERRERMRAAIRGQMEKEHANLIEIGTDSTLSNLGELDLQHLGGATGSASGALSTPQPTSRRSRWVAVLVSGSVVLALASLGVLARVFLVGSALAPAPPQVAAQSSASSRIEPVAPVASEVEAARRPTVDVHVVAIPKAAKLFFDGEPVDNPYSSRGQPGGVAHTVRAEAKGYATKTVDLKPSLDPIELVISLQPASAGHPAAGASPKGRPESSGAAPKLDCDSPFYRDADGIMRVKPECMR